MNSTGQTKECSATDYKTLLLEARRLRGRNGVAAYRRAKILCQVFDDIQFRADCCNVDDFAAAAILDEYVEDLCLSFLDLRRTLQRFPKIADWKDGRLARLFRETTKVDRQDRPLTGKPRPVSGETRERLETQLRMARESLARARAVSVSEIDQLRSRVAELEAENESLRRRIAELESGTIRV
jgi:hypothetical protein